MDGYISNEKLLQAMKYCRSDCNCTKCPLYDSCDMDADWLIHFAAERMEQLMADP